MTSLSRKEKERQQRKNDIVAAAEKIFLQKGFEAATMDDIAKEAQFSKKTLYSYFNGKEELYYEIMLAAFKTLNNLFDHTLEENSHLTEIEKIKKLGYVFIEFGRSNPGYLKSIMDYDNKELENETNLLLKECYTTGGYSLEVICKCISAGIEKGEFSEELDPSLIALVLWSNIIGVVNLINKKEKYVNIFYKKDIKDVIEAGFNVMMNGLKK